MITVAINPTEVGCPLVDGVPPKGCIAVTIVDGARTFGAWLRVQSPLIARLLAGETVAVDDAGVIAIRADLLYSHVRTTADRAAEAASIADVAAKGVVKKRRSDDLKDIRIRIKAIAAGTRTQTEKDLLAICRSLLGGD